MKENKTTINDVTSDVFPPLCPDCGHPTVWCGDIKATEMGYLPECTPEAEDFVVKCFACDCDTLSEWRNMEDGKLELLSITHFSDQDETYYTNYALMLKEGIGLEDPNPLDLDKTATFEGVFLGALVVDPEVIGKEASWIRYDYFTLPQYQEAYRYIKRLYCMGHGLQYDEKVYTAEDLERIDQTIAQAAALFHQFCQEQNLFPTWQSFDQYAQSILKDINRNHD